MNPLSVLRAQEVVVSGTAKVPKSARRLADGAAKAGVPLIVPAETPLKVLMELLVVSGKPAFVEDDEGHVIGTISMDDVVHALARY